MHDPVPIAATDAPGAGEVLVAGYNVENLFDEDDVAERIEQLGRVVRALGAGRGPDVLAVQEVANRDVVARLRDEALGDLGYVALAWEESEDPRGIDTAILSRLPQVGASKAHRVHDLQDHFWDQSTRHILEARYDVGGTDLVVFSNHWPSRRGGEPRKVQRLQVARKLRALVAERVAEGAHVVVLGDFNANPGEPSFSRRGLDATLDPDAVARGEHTLFHTLGDLLQQVTAMCPGVAFPKTLEEIDRHLGLLGHLLGTHYFEPEDSWCAFDQILLSQALVEPGGLRFVPGSMQVVREPFMLDDGGYPRCWADPDATEPGFSDHLPVMIRLRAE